MKNYAEKLQDPRWQKMRLEVMQRDMFRCRRCRAKDKTLNVHHLAYQKGKAPWEYDDVTLITLCMECHEEVEDYTCKLAFGAFMASNGMSLNTARLVLSHALIAAGVCDSVPPEICSEMLKMATSEEAVSLHAHGVLAKYEPGTVEKSIRALM